MVLAVIAGFQDSLDFIACVVALDRDIEIKRILGKVFVLSALLNIAIPISYDLLILPLITVNLTHSSIFRALFYMVYVVPISGISLFENASLYSRIAGRCFEAAKQTPSVKSRLVSNIYKFLVLANFLMLASIAYYIPFIGKVLSFICWSFLTSYYSFDYQWAAQNYSIDDRIAFFEQHWEYFLGFGIPTTIATFISTNPFINQAIFSLIFPCLVVMTRTSNPISSASSRIPSLPVFWIPKRMNVIIKFILKKSKKGPT